MSSDIKNNSEPSSRLWLIEFALAMGGFAIGTGEFATMGLMPEIAKGLAITELQVGHVISVYALGVVVGAPILAVFGANIARKALLLLLMGWFTLGNLACVLAQDYYSLLIFRFISGLPHGAYFGVAALVVAGMTSVDKRAQAVSRVMIGLSVSMLVGNPLATWLGQILGWRASFMLVTLTAVMTVLLVWIYVPFKAKTERHDPMVELRAFNQSQVWLALTISSIGFAGMFGVFSYLSPTLLEITRVDSSMIPWALAAFGLGGIIGNIVGGMLFDRIQFRAVAWILLWSAVVLLLFPATASNFWLILPSVFAVGTMVALGPALQTHLMDVAKDAQTLAAASNHAAFNIANALGPWLTGLVISAGFSWSVSGYVGAVTAMIGLMVFAVAWQMLRNSSQNDVVFDAEPCPDES